MHFSRGMWPHMRDGLRSLTPQTSDVSIWQRHQTCMRAVQLACSTDPASPLPIFPSGKPPAKSWFERNQASSAQEAAADSTSIVHVWKKRDPTPTPFPLSLPASGLHATGLLLTVCC